jgi:TonB family protein
MLPIIEFSMKTFVKMVALAFLFGSTGFCNSSQQVSVDGAAPQLVKRVEPEYPQMARIAHIQGDVLIAITITETGAVSNLKPLSGHPILIQAALDAVRQWKYSPILKDEKPTTMETVVKVGFYMGDSPEQVKKYAQIADRFYATMERCSEQLKDRRLDEAERTCKEAAAISYGLDPHRNLERGEAFQQTGHVLFLQRKFSEALENYRKELEYTSAAENAGAELAAAHYHIGNGLWGNGQLQDAKSEYEKAEALYSQAARQIGSQYLKNEYAKRIKTVLSDHASLLRRLGEFTAADALDRQAAAIAVKTGLQE